MFRDINDKMVNYLFYLLDPVVIYLDSIPCHQILNIFLGLIGLSGEGNLAYKIKSSSLIHFLALI